MQKIGFAKFVEMWSIMQGFDAPAIHCRMADWLENAWKKGDKKLLLLAFRASGKSTIVGLFCAWLLWINQDLRILILAAESSLAHKMVRNTRKIIEKHVLTRRLIPHKADQWASDRFTINRKKELRDPSVLGLGVMSNATGSRADIIIYDDVEVPNTSNSVEKRENLRGRLTETNFILVPGGTQLYIGTPHTYFSIYADQKRSEIGEEKIFLGGYKHLHIPIFNKDGDSAWPSQFTNEEIEQLHKQSGPNKFASQMLLKPVNIVEGRLDADLLKFYSYELDYAEAQRKIHLILGNQKIISCSVWWDPAFGSARGDKSVVAIIFCDDQGGYYLHHLHYMDIQTQNDQDEATLQCLQVVELVEKYYLPAIHIEINGIGKFLPAILRRELAKKNISCAVIEETTRKPKHERIIESFDAVMAARCLHVHENIRKTPFLTEMMEWQPEKNRGYDDGLDAVAGALSLEPVRLKNIYPMATRKWLSRSDMQQAKTDFEV